MQPLIGISAFIDHQQRADYVSVSDHYPRSVRESGGIPVIIPVSADTSAAEIAASRIDGLLLTGGKDISPHRYGEDPVRQIGPFDAMYDEWEFALLKAALARNIPVLGICRGAQLTNVALGGNLYQDIFSQRDGVAGHNPENFPAEALFHSIAIVKKDSLIACALGENPGRINSFHHQAVKTLAPGLVATALAPDGIIEAYESIDNTQFIFGVQFHPEMLTRKFPVFSGIFRLFVEAAARKIARSE